MSGSNVNFEAFKEKFNKHLKKFSGLGFNLKDSLNKALTAYQKTKTQGSARLWFNDNYRILKGLIAGFPDDTSGAGPELAEQNLEALYQVLNSRDTEGNQTNMSWLLSQALGISWNPGLGPENIFYALHSLPESLNPRPEADVLQVVNCILLNAVSADLSPSFFNLMADFALADLGGYLKGYPVTREFKAAALGRCLAELKADLPLNERGFRILGNGLFATLVNENNERFKQLMALLVTPGNELESFPDYVQKACSCSLDKMHLMLDWVRACASPSYFYTAGYPLVKQSSDLTSPAEIALFLADFEAYSRDVLTPLSARHGLTHKSLLLPKLPRDLIKEIDDVLKRPDVGRELLGDHLSPIAVRVLLDFIRAHCDHKERHGKFANLGDLYKKFIVESEHYVYLPFLGNIIFQFCLMVLDEVEASRDGSSDSSVDLGAEFMAPDPHDVISSLKKPWSIADLVLPPSNTQLAIGSLKEAVAALIKANKESIDSHYPGDTRAGGCVDNYQASTMGFCLELLEKGSAILAISRDAILRRFIPLHVPKGFEDFHYRLCAFLDSFIPESGSECSRFEFAGGVTRCRPIRPRLSTYRFGASDQFSGSGSGAGGAGSGAACGSSDGAGAGAGGWVAPVASEPDLPSAPPAPFEASASSAASVEPVPADASFQVHVNCLISSIRSINASLKSSPSEPLKKYVKLVLIDFLLPLSKGDYSADDVMANCLRERVVPEEVRGFDIEFQKLIDRDLSALRSKPSSPPEPVGSAPFCDERVGAVSAAVSPGLSSASPQDRPPRPVGRPFLSR